MLILVTYEPPPGGRDRTPDFQRLIAQHAPGNHYQPLANRWLIATDEPVDAWVERLGPPGRYLVLRVQGQPNGYLPTEAWDWIRAHV